MLEKLALNHLLWVKMAKGICKDAYLADDLVSEMYLKVANYNKELNEFYIYFTIKHIYINYLKEEKKYTTLEDSVNVIDEDELKKEIEIPDCLTWVEKQILLLRQNSSCRDMEKQYRINKDKINRIEIKAKNKLIQWVDTNKITLKDLEML